MAIGLLITASQLKTTKVLGFPAERTWKLIKGSSRFANGVFFGGEGGWGLQACRDLARYSKTWDFSSLFDLE